MIPNCINHSYPAKYYCEHCGFMCSENEEPNQTHNIMPICSDKDLVVLLYQMLSLKQGISVVKSVQQCMIAYFETMLTNTNTQLSMLQLEINQKMETAYSFDFVGISKSLEGFVNSELSKTFESTCSEIFNGKVMEEYISHIMRANISNQESQIKQNTANIIDEQILSQNAEIPAEDNAFSQVEEKEIPNKPSIFASVESDKEINSCIADGKEMMRSCDYISAINFFRNALNCTSTDKVKAQIYYHLGEAYSNMQNIRESLENYQKAITIYSTIEGAKAEIAEIYYLTGIIHFNDHKYHHALSQFYLAQENAESISDIMNRAKISYYTARAHMELGNYQKGSALLANVIQITKVCCGETSNLYADANFYQAECNFSMGDKYYQLSICFYKVSCAIYQKNKEFLKLAVTQYKLGGIYNLINNSKMAIKKYVLAASAYAEIKDYGGVCNSFDSAIKLCRNNALLQVNYVKYYKVLSQIADKQDKKLHWVHCKMLSANKLIGHNKNK